MSALAPVLSHRGGLWIGWPGLPLEPGGSWEAVLAEGYRERGYELVPVLLSDEEVKGFYEGFANAILWPLFHDLLGQCNFDPSFWYAYLEVNEKFADSVLAARPRARTSSGCRTTSSSTWPSHARRRREAARIGFFLHIPFPPLDILLKLPWRGQILKALLAYDLLGFQTPRDTRNFLTCIENLLPEVEIEDGGPITEVRLGSRAVKVGAFPIGIDFKSYDDAARSGDVARRMVELRERMGPREIIVGVDRLDYTKGLVERLKAFRNALQRHTELREQAILFQVVVPSREGVPEYQTLKADVERLVGEINGEFSTAGWVPVHYHYKSLARRDLLALYRMARVCFVTSIKDGMNLVAKEFCACQIDGAGVLVLSEFAGAAAQLQEGALLVNPHDIEGMADALKAAFDMGGRGAPGPHGADAGDRPRAGYLLVGGLLSPGRPGHRAGRLPGLEGIFSPSRDRRVSVSLDAPFRPGPLGRDRGTPARPPPRPLPRLRRHPLADRAPSGPRHPARGDAGGAPPPRGPRAGGDRLRPRPGGRGRPRGPARPRLRREPRLRHRRPAPRRGVPLRLEVGEGIPEKIERAAARLRRDLDGIEGVLVEPKRFAISIHFRLADERRPAGDRARGRRRRWRPSPACARGTARSSSSCAPTSTGTRGKPSSGSSTPSASTAPDVLPFYIGDDLTDEDAFRAVRGRGIGILVAGEPRETAAEYQLRDPARWWSSWSGWRDALLRLPPPAEGSNRRAALNDPQAVLTALENAPALLVPLIRDVPERLVQAPAGCRHKWSAHEHFCHVDVPGAAVPGAPGDDARRGQSRGRALLPRARGRDRRTCWPGSRRGDRRLHPRAGRAGGPPARAAAGGVETPGEASGVRALHRLRHGPAHGPARPAARLPDRGDPAAPEWPEHETLPTRRRARAG